MTGVCRNRGAVGGLQALSALESSPFARVFLQPLPVQGGFHAAYAGTSQALIIANSTQSLRSAAHRFQKEYAAAQSLPYPSRPRTNVCCCQ